MFVCTIRSAKLKWVILLLLCTAAVLAFFFLRTGNRPAAQDGAISLRAADAQERLAFISQFGWDVEEDPAEVREIIIPTEFDTTYEKYNAVQKAQNLDLTLYGGKRVKRWTYAVRNYPGYEGRGDIVQISLLVYDGLVIGGDVRVLMQDGILQGFDFPQPAVQTTDSP